jgi:hypothetical protein
MRYGRSAGLMRTGLSHGSRLGAYLSSALALFVVFSSGVKADHGGPADEVVVTMPKYVYVAPCLRRTIDEMLQRSPTFRAQVEALSRAQKLGVAITLVASPGPRPADATIRRFHSGLLLAVINIHSIVDKEELIAHEVEHLLEQVEGVSLKRLAEIGADAWRTGASYETLRAIAAGRRVASEMRMREAPTP